MNLMVCAQTPLPPWIKKRPIACLLGIDQVEGHETLIRKASCLSYVTAGIPFPSILLIHASGNLIVSVKNSQALYQALKKTNHEVDFYEIKDCDAHGGALFYKRKILNIIQNFCMRNC